MATTCILLTPAQATLMRGPTGPGAALDPVSLPDGVGYGLPVQVLDDPAHALWHQELADLPRFDIADDAEPLPGASL